jgi:tetratricopeptide (TPR) repeat protein
MPDESKNNDATQPVRANVENTQPDASNNPMDEATRPVSIANVPTQRVPAPDGATQPQSVNAGSEKPPTPPEQKPVRLWRKRLIILAIVIILIGAGIGSYSGYAAGIQTRIENRNNQVVMEAATHFQNGLDAMNEKQYSIARAQFEYVIKIDPNFPGVKEKLAEVMIALLPTAIPTATLTPTPEFTPTPDMRGEEQIFSNIQSLLTSKNWEQAITSIESLRTKNLGYKTIQVDGFYYVALRNRGVDKILRLGDLEGGMYDLALSSRFGPLDAQADSYRLYARYYEIGASFWEVDWEKAMSYFQQVAPYLPNLRDASNIFAIDRYRQAAANYAQKLMDTGDSCKAKKVLDTVFVNNYRNATFEPLATRVANECSPATETPKPTEKTTATPSLTPTGGASLTPTSTTSGPAATRTPTSPSAATNTPTTASKATDTPTPKPPTATSTPTPK